MHGELVALEVPRGSGYDSQSGLNNLFPQVFGRLAAEGCSYSSLVEEAKLERARALMADPGHSLKQIASLCGFADISTFHRAFKRWTGLTPSVFRSARVLAS